ncbi:MAG: DUF2156 domain-containing protein [Lachnospiraceae bacterium]|nr:DUF2156 domain-containing protein [Lachnospiraceae bacterium]
MERAAKIICAYGEDSQHLLSLNAENNYFFAAGERGVIPYCLEGRRAMSQGDPACPPEDLEAVLREYLDFCKSRGYRPVFNSVSGKVGDLLNSRDFCILKYGEEAILKLPDYTLAGGKRGALRRNVAKLDRAGVVLEEYCPQKARNSLLEKEISDLEEQWFAGKKLQLKYSIGGLEFEKPRGRRYFITRDAEGKLLTVLSFLPYCRKTAWCLDVMYRRMDGPTGEMEHAIISACRKMREDGAEEVSLNIAPLAGIDITKPDTKKAERMMYEIFNHMDFEYDFKNLYRFKSKFDPSVWRPRYLVYDRRITLVRLATTITNTKGAADPVLYRKYKKFFITSALKVGRDGNS